MRVIRDEAFINKQAKLTQYGSLAAMAMLIISLILSSSQPLISWALLIVGFGMAMVFVRIGNHYVRPPRPDMLLDKLLKGLDNRYVLYHYLQPAEHLLLTPSGLVAIEVRDSRGRVSVRNGRWSQAPFTQKLRVLIGDSGLGNPFADARREIVRTQRNVSELQGENAVPFDGVVVFTSGKAQLTAEKPEMPVVLTEDLRSTLRELAEGHPVLTTSQRKNLDAALRGESEAEDTEATE
jgi:hypothetical protein